MANSERATVPRRTKAMSRQISDQIARTVRAHAAVNRACRTRNYADRQVASTVHLAAAETARLAEICGSVETTARVLGLTPDEVQRLIRRAHRRGPDRRPQR